MSTYDERFLGAADELAERYLELESVAPKG